MGLGLQLAEGELLQLVHETVHADAFRQRRVDVHRLAGDAAALVLGLDEVQRPHVVQPVGELDQQHANVVRHGEQELAQILGLALAVGLRLDLRQLGDAIDQPADACAEQAVDLFLRRHRILDGIVQDAGGDGLVIQLEVGQDARHLDRMAEIRIARRPQLRPVRPHRKHIGAVQQVLVRIGIIGLYALDEFILTQHPAIVG